LLRGWYITDDAKCEFGIVEGKEVRQQSLLVNSNRARVTFHEGLVRQDHLCFPI